jgi:hypothetical protein
MGALVGEAGILFCLGAALDMRGPDGGRSRNDQRRGMSSARADD